MMIYAVTSCAMGLCYRHHKLSLGMHDFIGCQPCHPVIKKSRKKQKRKNKIRDSFGNFVPAIFLSYSSDFASDCWNFASLGDSTPHVTLKTTLLTIAKDTANMSSDSHPRSNPSSSGQGSSWDGRNNDRASDTQRNVWGDGNNGHGDGGHQGNGGFSQWGAGFPEGDWQDNDVEPKQDEMEEWDEWDETQDDAITDYYALLNIPRDVLIGPFLTVIVNAVFVTISRTFLGRNR